MEEQFTLTASVAPDAMSKVTRLFNASLDDIVTELLQNARRSGATKVWFQQYEHSELGEVIAVSDNGPGLEDPASLFQLGRSGWDADTCSAEDAAGMGFFSLAGRRTRIIAENPKGDGSNWVLDVSPKAFSGEEPIEGIEELDEQTGTTILFAAKPGENIVPAANAAAKYCSIPVYVQCEEVERKDYLNGAVHIETWKGIRIGVFPGTSFRGHVHHNTNFHGLTLNIPLPSLSQSYHDQLHIRLDVEACRDLKLVLPARKEVVQDAFYDTLRDEIERTLFKVVAKAATHSLSFKDHQRAAALGIKLSSAVKQLRPFSPSHADRDSNDWPAPIEVKNECFLFSGADEAVEEQNFAWAVSKDASDLAVYEPNSAFAGYDWYDAIAKIEVTGYRWGDGETSSECDIEDVPVIKDRPDRLWIIGTCHQGESATPWSLSTDFILFAPADAHIDEAAPCLTKSAKLTVDDLVDFMERALFSPSTDCDADSYDRQRQWFTDEAEDTAIAYLQTPSDVHRNQVERVIRRELYWILRPTSEISISIRGSSVDIDGLDTAFQTKAA